MKTENETVLILGFGRSGQSAAAYLTESGASVIGVDRRAAILQPDFSFPIVDEPVSESIGFAIKSPGIPFDHPWVLQLQAKGIEVIGEVAFACSQLRSSSKKLLAITGSNGKTTTTLLTTHFLNKVGKKTMAVGNIGTPLISQINSGAEILVIELSSFQLEDLDEPIFDDGLILNITPNHLDRYPSFEAYAAAKLRLQHCLKPGATLYVPKETKEKFLPFWKEKVETIFPLSYREREAQMSEHEVVNIRAAYSLCQKFGVSEEDVWEGLKDFQKPPHRLEFIRCLKGITFVNDSKATSVDAMRKGVLAQDTPVVLIAGGVDKGGSFSELVPDFRGKVRQVFAIGEAADRIQRELSPVIKVTVLSTLKEAVHGAYQTANKGESVLLSPGCSSFDQFQNYEDRGERFNKFVEVLGE